MTEGQALVAIIILALISTFISRRFLGRELRELVAVGGLIGSAASVVALRRRWR